MTKQETRASEVGYLGAWCADCGRINCVDEDGLCTMCGNGAVGDGANEAIANADALEAAEAERDEALAEVARLREGIASVPTSNPYSEAEMLKGQMPGKWCESHHLLAILSGGKS